MEMLDSSCEWKDSVVFPRQYAVSSNGQVYSKRTNKILKPNKDRDGYLYYVLCVGGERRTVKAHRLVALTFMENRDGKATVDHINADRADNRIENLRWATLGEQWANEISYNRHKKAAIEVGKRNRGKPSQHRTPVAVYKGRNIVGLYPSIREAAESLGLRIEKVSECANGKRKTTGGYSVAKYHFPEGANDG